MGKIIQNGQFTIKLLRGRTLFRSKALQLQEATLRATPTCAALELHCILRGESLLAPFSILYKGAFLSDPSKPLAPSRVLYS
eukprot:1557648-Amphidinium_carterae.1